METVMRSWFHYGMRMAACSGASGTFKYISKELAGYYICIYRCILLLMFMYMPNYLTMGLVRLLSLCTSNSSYLIQTRIGIGTYTMQYMAHIYLYTCRYIQLIYLQPLGHRSLSSASPLTS